MFPKPILSEAEPSTTKLYLSEVDGYTSCGGAIHCTFCVNKIKI